MNSPGFAVALIALVASLVGCRKDEGVSKGDRPWTVLNMDCNYYETRFPDSMMTPEAMDRHVGEFLRGGVTHFLVNPQGMATCYPSKVTETVWDRMPWTKADPLKTDWVRRSKAMADKGVDRFQVFIDAARRRHVEGWISMRMNDVHGVNDKDSQQCSLWHEHPELWREPNTSNGNNWFLRAFDYAHQEVRDHHVHVAEELLERYDMDGFDADWTRFPAHLTPGKERTLASCLTEVMRAIRRRARIEEKRRGHRILVSATVLSSPDASLGAGMDAETWAKEDLVDVLFVANFFACIDFDTPYAEWMRLIRAANPRVRIVNRVDCYVQVYPGTELWLDNAGYRGYFDNLMSQGCCDFAFFNMFDTGTEKACMILDNGIVESCVRKFPRKYVVTYRDYVAAGTDARRQLPTVLDGPKEISVTVGTVSDAGSVCIELAASESLGESFKPTLNGVPANSPPKEVSEIRWFDDNQLYKNVKKPKSYRVGFPVSALRSGQNSVGLPSVKGVKVFGMWVVLGANEPKKE